MQPKISAIVIYFNEETLINECLRRINFCNEIIIIYLGLPPKITDLNTHNNIKVYSHQWVPYAELVRNFAIEKTTHQWVLFTDPDLFYPNDMDGKLRSIINSYERAGLAAILFPYVNYFSDEPLKFGKKASKQSYTGVINKNYISQIDGLVHHRGLKFDNKGIQLGILNCQLKHYWINNISDAYEKAKRYLPFEGEGRFLASGYFRFQRSIKEVLRCIVADIKTKAFLEKKSRKVMFFNAWYKIKANYEWYKYSRSMRKE